MLMTLLNRFSKLMLDFTKNPFLVIFMFLVEMIDQVVKKKNDKNHFNSRWLSLGSSPISQLHNRDLTCPISLCPPHRPFVTHLSRCANV